MLKSVFNEIYLQLDAILVAHPYWTVHKMADKIFCMYDKVDCPWIIVPNNFEYIRNSFFDGSGQ